MERDNAPETKPAPTVAGDQLDDELRGLFSRFDDVKASDELKASALARIAALHDAEADADEGEPDTPTVAPTQTAERTIAPARAAKGKGRRSKWRAIRIAALAACLVLALTGGVAYAVPYSHVTVSSGDSSIELGVNVFGITVSAESADGRGRAIVDELDLRNKPYADSMTAVVESYAGDEGLDEIRVDAEGGMRNQLQEAGSAIVDEHAHAPEGDSPSASKPADEANDSADGNQSRQPGSQPDSSSTSQAPQPDGTGDNPSPDQPPQPDGAGRPGQDPQDQPRD